MARWIPAKLMTYHGHNSSNNHHFATGGRATDLALQQRLGILSNRRTWTDLYYPSSAGFAGQDIG
jgi:hypothetical protein